MAVYNKPHRISKLALEPTDMLATLVNSWVAGWFLVPLRAYVLEKLVAHVLSQRDTYSVNSAIASRLSLGPRGVRVNAGKIALCCAVDVCLGLSFWVGEWLIVRSAGTKFFNWGSL